MTIRIFALFAALLLAACGFQPKGRLLGGSLPVRAWHVAGNSLQQPLEDALRHADALPVAAAHAQADLEIVNIDSKKDIYTITRAAKLNEYLLSLKVSAQVYRNGQPWGAPIEVEVRRTLPYADSMVLGKQEEEQTVWKEMQADAAEQIVYRLRFLSAE